MCDYCNFAEENTPHTEIMLGWRLGKIMPKQHLSDPDVYIKRYANSQTTLVCSYDDCSTEIEIYHCPICGNTFYRDLNSMVYVKSEIRQVEEGSKKWPDFYPLYITESRKENNMKDLNLVPAIREIESQISEIKARHREELEPYEQSLVELRKINTACEKCGGSGEVFKRSCAEDDGDMYPCDACQGTGKIQRRTK